MNYFAVELDSGVVTGYNKTLDDEVNKDYASILIPRAIGYSTALLDYFFRGKIAVTIPAGGVTAQSYASTGFDSVTLTAANISELNNGLTAGTVDLVVPAHVLSHQTISQG